MLRNTGKHFGQAVESVLKKINAIIKTRSSNFPECDNDARGSFHGKSSRAVGNCICGPSRIIQLLRQECYTE